MCNDFRLFNLPISLIALILVPLVKFKKRVAYSKFNFRKSKFPK